MAGTRERQNRLILKLGGGFAYIAVWQSAIFLLLILMVWANEVIDLTALIFGVERTPMDVTRGCVSTAGVLIAWIVTVGNTYLQQRHIVSGLLTICSYCKKIRIDNQVWQRVEEYIGRRSSIDFTHSVCPECYVRVKAMIDAETDDGK